ncbi:MAG: nucleotidyl transferase AbiEii/AbiGii toxin family protein [Prevotellaceae bacterium]|jgi:predicted nucleotidyltransferase component of viral defense system|nr:nucleotidyl transferase AbiEii/AbiGii toxin family protein [Prevotellaceae bacterium]
MIDTDKYRFLIIQILKDVYADIELSNYLGLKGETALMLYYNLPRCAIDLDFNLIDHNKEKPVLEKIKNILMKYGNIFDLAIIFFGQTITLSHGIENRKTKIEISKQESNNNYEIKNLLGINMRVMTVNDILANKLCDMSDSSAILNRSIFDTWFLLNRNIDINKFIVESKTKMKFNDYLQKCINKLETIESTELLDGMEEYVRARIKNFILTKLLPEIIKLLIYNKNK